MAFTCADVEPVNAGWFSTAFQGFKFGLKMPYYVSSTLGVQPFPRVGFVANWGNIGNYSTSGTSGTSGTGGTTIVVGGSYTWIG